MSKTSTIVTRLRPDGTLVGVKPDGTEVAVVVPRVARRSRAAIEAAAWRDPDARPPSEAEFRQMKRVPRVKSLRRALQLTQEEFAARYHIPLGTLRDWEQGRKVPDQTARAYLRAIAGDPVAVLQALRGRRAA